MAELMTVGEWLRNQYQDYDPALSPRSRAVEARMASAFGFEMPKVGYRRYADPVALAVAAHYVRSTAAEDMGCQARLANCGMSAIRVVLDAAELMNGDLIVAGSTLYGLTSEMIIDLNGRFGVDVDFVASDDHEALASAARGGADFVFVETIGNGQGMPVCDVAELMDQLWGTKLTLVLDNTFLTAALFDPWKLYQQIREKRYRGQDSAFTFVVVESLSKYYRVGPEDTATAGLIVAPPEFIERCDCYLAWGAGIQLPQLSGFPFELYDAAKHVMPKLSANAAAVAEYLKTRPHPLIEQVYYPNDHPFIQEYAGGQAGGVIYLRINTDKPGLGERWFARAGIMARASFGHTEMTHVDFGWHNPQKNPLGLIRLAMGTQDTPEESVDKIKRALL